MTPARYVHTNLVARDWRRLSGFYERVFGCEPAGPERDLCGPWLDRGTGVENARIRGVHLRLPGHGRDGPTLEIFAYESEEDAPVAAANRPGYGHIAFAVDDVEAARRAVLDAGGSDVGKVVSADIPDAGSLQFIYVADPEGNLIELQRWGD
jgi:catechol 2,3-dioxygenase-like lactoylglutathione lyase family enzyme